MKVSEINSNSPGYEDITRYKPLYLQIHGENENFTSEYMNIFSMLFSILALMMKFKWFAWFAIFCSSINFANSPVNEDSKQIMTSFMLSISSVMIIYLQNPNPLLFPYTN